MVGSYKIYEVEGERKEGKKTEIGLRPHRSSNVLVVVLGVIVALGVSESAGIQGSGMGTHG